MNSQHHATSLQGGGATSDTTNNQGRANRSFADLFKDNRVHRDSSQLHYIEQADGQIKLAIDEIESVEDTHGFCLVGYVYGPRPGPYNFVNFIKGWGSGITFIFKENGWIKFKFPTAEDRDRVMNGGPYMILGRRLFLKTLPSCFLYSKDEMMLLPTWVQIFGLPAECWTIKALSKIASTVGKPLHTDNMTITKKGAQYARVLVEMDAKQTRLWEQVITIPNGSTITVTFKYELEPKVCDKCNSLGHLSDMCGVKVSRKHYQRKNLGKAPVQNQLFQKSQLPREVSTGEQGLHNYENQNTEAHWYHDMDKNLNTKNPVTKGSSPDNQVPPPIITDKGNSSQVAQGNSHIYFEDDASIHSCNSEPYESFNDMDDWRTSRVNDAKSCGEITNNDEWITVSKKHNRRGKAKAYNIVSQRPLTRSKSLLLLQMNSNEVRLPLTALFDT